MKRIHLFVAFLLISACCSTLAAQTKKSTATKASNPLIFSDVPDMSMIRVGTSYYMTSTTMHMNPGVPVMKSNDLTNWQTINYCYETLGSSEVMDLENNKNTYGRGSWASCIRYHKGLYYISTFAQTTGMTYIYTTKSLEKGPFVEHSFKPSFHDCTIYFDEDGKLYMIYGSGRLFIQEIKSDLSGVVEGSNHVLIENASAPAGPRVGLGSEGSQLFKYNGKYYLFNICWPSGSMRTVVCHRADKITGPYEGKVVFQDLGVAQGGIVDTPDGRWFAYLFRDFGAVGRIPYLVPMTWVDGWPCIGVNGKVPATLDLPASKGLIPGIVASDEFTRKKGERALPLVWQWNHNPNNGLWSISKRSGYLRLTTGRVDASVLQAKNTLTQRTIGPVCAGSTSLDVSNMKNGDVAGLILLQAKYGQIAVEMKDGAKSIVMYNVERNRQPAVEAERVALNQKIVYFKAECNFTDKIDQARFFYSLDGKTWKQIGSQLKMEYTMPHFMGYRFGLYNYATQTAGGFVDFDFFHISDKISSWN
jgi:beta-xylosidase